MSEEDIHNNGDLSGEEKVTQTEPKTVREPTEKPELKPEAEGEVISPIMGEGTDMEGVSKAATEVAMREGGEQLQPTTKRRTSKSQTRSKRQTSVERILKSLADISQQIEKQASQFNRMNQNLQSVQKQMRTRKGQTEIVSQIRSQANQIQRQIFQVQKTAQKRPSVILRRTKK
jgi:ABC-type transporter Mla subunit MlaD